MKTADEAIPGPGVVVYLMEELTDARLRCEQLKHYVAEAAKMVSESTHRDHFWEVAGHLMHGIPEALFKLDKALSAAGLAANKLDNEQLKQNLRPEKAEELERVLEDARIRYVQRRSGEDTMTIRPKQAADQLQAMADTIDATGHFPLGPMLQLIAALEGNTVEGPAGKMATVPVAGLVVPATYLRSLVEAFTPKPGFHPVKAHLVRTLRGLVTGALSSDTLALLQSAGSREEVMDGFKKENPALTEDQLKEIADKWEENKDVVKDKTAETDVTAETSYKAFLSKAEAALAKAKSAGEDKDAVVDAIGAAIRSLGAALVTTDVPAVADLGEKIQDMATRVTRTKMGTDVEAATPSEAMVAFADAFEAAKLTYMAARQGNDRKTAVSGLMAIANMSSALTKLAPEHMGELGRINSMAVRLMAGVKSEAAKGDVLAASDRAAMDLDRAVAQAKRTLSFDVINPLKSLSKLTDDGVYTMAHGEPKQDFKIPGMVNNILEACQKVLGQVTDLEHTKTAAEADKDSKFEEGKPADPTKNMSPEQKAKWKAENEKHKDEFKAARGTQGDEAEAWKA